MLPFLNTPVYMNTRKFYEYPDGLVTEEQVLAQNARKLNLLEVHMANVSIDIFLML